MLRYDVAIIGGGFAGMMILHHLATLAAPDMRIVIFEPREKLGEGPAYGTRNPHHLLNVPANKIGAFPEQPEHFLNWLNTQQGNAAATKIGIAPREFLPTDFVPRALFAAYISDILAATRQMAKTKNIIIDHLPAAAQSVTQAANGEFHIATAHRTIGTRKLVLALGNLPPQPSEHPTVIRDIWHFDYATLKDSTQPVAIIGAGLTMVDVFLSLTYAGHKGPVHAISRHALMPRVHAPLAGTYDSGVEHCTKQPQPLSQLMKLFRYESRQCEKSGITWQMAMDKWRPHLPALWKIMSLSDRRKFVQRLYLYWNIHRHRMAPASSVVIEREIAAGRLALHQQNYENGEPLIIDGQTSQPTLIFDCRGPSYDIARSNNALIRQMLKDGLIERHDTGWGIKVDDHFRVAGKARNLYAIGTLAIGERLETTAVPELRGQAKDIAAALMAG